MNRDGEHTPTAIRLRYAGKCRSCSVGLPAGVVAVYDRGSKTVTCAGCSGSEAVANAGASNAAHQMGLLADHDETLEAREMEISAGIAGASARREAERRSNNREARIREAHPKLGGLILALSEDPQSTKAWEVGARGEEKLGRRLDGLKSETVHLLHDRRIPGSRANIDHIAVCPSGVFVIDAKKYKGRPSLRVDGGFFRERTEKLLVGSRDCTKLVQGAQKQVTLVLAELAKAGLTRTPVNGILCFVEADWPIFGGDFSTSGIRVLWPKKAAELISKPGPVSAAETQQFFRMLAAAFPQA